MQKYFPITFAGACTDVWLRSKLNRLSTSPSPLSTSPLSTSASTLSTWASSLQRTDDPPVMSAFLYLFKWDRGCEYILAKFQTTQMYIWFCHKLNQISGEKMIEIQSNLSTRVNWTCGAFHSQIIWSSILWMRYVCFLDFSTYGKWIPIFLSLISEKVILSVVWCQMGGWTNCRSWVCLTKKLLMVGGLHKEQTFTPN